MNVNTGDKAVSIFSVNQNNIGRIVKVEEYIGRFEQKEQFDFRGLPCEAPVTDHYWWIEATGLKNQFGDSPKAYIADSWLEPIRPETGKKSATHVVKDKEVERQAA